MGRADGRLPHRHPQTQVWPVRVPTAPQPHGTTAPGTHSPTAPQPCAARSNPQHRGLSFVPPCRLRRDSSGIFDYQEGWDPSPDGKNGLEDSFESSHQLKRLLGPPQPPLFCDQPDLTSLIDTNFSEHAKAEPEPRLRAVGARHKDSASGYDFSSLVGKVYEEHGSSSCRNMNFPGLSAPHGPAGLCGGGSDEGGGCGGRRRSLGERGLGEEPCAGCDTSSALPSWGGDPESSVWSLELQGNLIVAGRSNGKLEVRSWDAGTGRWR